MIVSKLIKVKVSTIDQTPLVVINPNKRRAVPAKQERPLGQHLLLFTLLFHPVLAVLIHTFNTGHFLAIQF